MRRLTTSTTIMLTLLASAVWANPSPGFEEQFLGVYWFVKTAPVNYVVDLLALFGAVWATGQVITVAWRYMPLYAVPVFVAGYFSDYAASYLLDVSFFHIPSGHEQLVGSLASNYSVGKMEPSTAVAFMALATGLIFVCNLPIIFAILRLNNADTYSRLPLAAGLVALLTAPYLSIRGEANASVMLVPLFLVGCGGLIYCTICMCVSSLRRSKR